MQMMFLMAELTLKIINSIIYGVVTPLSGELRNTGKAVSDGN